MQIVRISVYSDNLAIFWKKRAGRLCPRRALLSAATAPAPPTTPAAGLLSDDLCRAFAGEVPCYIFIDDFHLLTDGEPSAFLCTLANRLPAIVHLIVASRDRFLPAAETVRLGRRLYPIGTEQLRLNHTELAVYAHRCGAAALRGADRDPALFQRGVVLRHLSEPAHSGRAGGPA